MNLRNVGILPQHYMASQSRRPLDLNLHRCENLVPRVVISRLNLLSKSWKSRDSSVDIALRYGLDNTVLGFYSWWGLGIFLFTTASRTALGSTQPPTQWMPGASSLEIKRPGLEADHSPPSSAEVKEWIELYLHSPIRLRGVVPT
jgi:hypothetical protein